MESIPFVCVTITPSFPLWAIFVRLNPSSHRPEPFARLENRRFPQYRRRAKVEPFYGTDYSCEALPEELIQSWEGCGRRGDLRLPEPNPVIATVNTPT